MSTTDDAGLGGFLRARRAQVGPADVGLAAGGPRRVQGLRREELALLAGISTDYYIRLEQGRDRHPSREVLEALARVLQLDEDAVRHMQALTRPTRRRRRPTHRATIRPSVEVLVHAMTQTPAAVVDRYLTVLTANPLAQCLHSGLATGRNLLRDVFLDPGTADAYPELEAVRRETVAGLRAFAGTDLDDPFLTDLVGELSLKSRAFGQMWARQDVRHCRAGTKRFRNPLVGDLTLAYDSFDVGGSTGQTMIVYTAAPGSQDHDALTLLSALAHDRTGSPATAAPSSPSRAQR
ncbi:helix-turn-helix domain-containing protein [Pseudonocardia sichuanensis]